MCKLIVGLAPNDSHESGAFDFEEASPGIEMNKFSKLAAKTNPLVLLHSQAYLLIALLENEDSSTIIGGGPSVTDFFRFL